jgi:subtilisin family serine protease
MNQYSDEERAQMTTQNVPTDPESLSMLGGIFGMARYIAVLEGREATSPMREFSSTVETFGPAAMQFCCRKCRTFILKMTPTQAQELRERHGSHLEAFELDAPVYLASSWGFDRILRERPCGPVSSWPASTGKGVDLYVIDSGIAPLSEFGRRLQKGYQERGPRPPGEHGTAMAVIAASQNFGVAPGTSIIPVPVIPDTGRGRVSSVICGLCWVIDHHAKRSAPAVVLMALATKVLSRGLNYVVNAAIKAGITCVVAAGNGGRDVCDVSPASVQAAITVGAIMRGNCSGDRRLPGTNDGAGVTFFAPGHQIQSLDPNSIPQPFSGTSVAAAMVAGVVALYLEQCGGYPGPEGPEAVKQALLGYATSSMMRNRKIQGKRHPCKGNIISACFCRAAKRPGEPALTTGE